MDCWFPCFAGILIFEFPFVFAFVGGGHDRCGHGWPNKAILTEQMG
jgi:hypothetical protein